MLEDFDLWESHVFSVFQGAKEAVMELLTRGADINAKGGKYGTPFQAACCNSAMNNLISPKDGTAVVELLLERGADVNARGGKFGTALQAAAYHHRKFVELFVEEGCGSEHRGWKVWESDSGGEIAGGVWRRGP